MGVIINEVCCINLNREYENNPTQYMNGQGNDTYKKLSSFDKNKYSDTMSQKSFPLNEIKFNNEKNNSEIEIKSLSKIPINTEKVIRQLSGNPLEH